MSGEHEEDILFQVPVPPPPFPPVPPHGPNMVYVRHRVEDGEGRESEDLMLRKVPRGRSLTHAQYLAALVALHEATRTLAESGHAEVEAELERLGLTTVTV